MPAQRAMVTHPPYRLPRYMLLDLPRDVIRTVARFRLRVHTLRVETATWNSASSPTCDLCEAEMSKMKNMFSFTARNFRWFLSAGSTRSYFCFFTPGKQQTPSFPSWTYFTLWTGEQSYFLTEGLFFVNLVVRCFRRVQCYNNKFCTIYIRSPAVARFDWWLYL